MTLSDIQKLPVRTALFSLFIHLEILLTEFLRRNLNSVDPFTLLSAGRAEKARIKWQRFKDGNMEQDQFAALDFCDKRTLLKRHKSIGKPAKQIEDELGEIETRLRNLIAHPKRRHPRPLTGHDWFVTGLCAYVANWSLTALWEPRFLLIGLFRPLDANLTALCGVANQGNAGNSLHQLMHYPSGLFLPSPTSGQTLHHRRFGTFCARRIASFCSCRSFSARLTGASSSGQNRLQ